MLVCASVLNTSVANPPVLTLIMEMRLKISALLGQLQVIFSSKEYVHVSLPALLSPMTQYCEILSVLERLFSVIQIK